MRLALGYSRRTVWEAVGLTCSAVAVVGGEIYLRHTATHVVPDSRRIGNVIDGESSPLIVNTPRGKRLFPNLNVIIRNQTQSKRDVSIRTNSLGMRAEEIPKERKKGEYRIVVLGDSIVFGDAVEFDQLFTQRAQSDLRRASKRFVRVIDAGVPDFGTKEEIDVLEESILSLHPDRVLVEFYMNDSRPPWGFSGELGNPGWIRRHSLLADLLYQRFKLVRWMSTTGQGRFEWVHWDYQLDWKHDRSQFLRLAALARYDWGAAWQEGSWRTVEREFARLKSLSKSQGFDVTVVCFPVAFQVFADYNEDAPQKRVGEIARRLGFQYFDLLPEFRAARGRKLFYDQCHLTPEGHELVGGVLSRILANEVPSEIH